MRLNPFRRKSSASVNYAPSIPTEQNLGYNTPGNFTGSKSVTVKPYGSVKGLDWQRIASKSYESIWDSTETRAILKNIKHFAIGSGLRLQSNPAREILGISATDSQAAARRLETSWRLWSHSKDADHSRGNTYQQLQGIAFMSMLVWGEYFAIRRWSSDPSRMNPLTIQLIPPHQVCNPGTDIVYAAEKIGRVIKDGIETDASGREIAIYIRQFNRQKGYFFTRIPCQSTTGRQIVLHGFVAEEVGQVRGTPFLAPILHDAEKITDMILFELDSAAVNASMAGAITSDKDAPISMADMSKLGQGAGWAGTMIGSNSDTLPESTTLNPSPNITPVRTLDRGGIINQNLPPGHHYEGIDTKRPNLNIPEFIEKRMVYMTAALGIPLELVQMKFGQNYSASKASLELGWRIFEYLGSEFSADFNQPNYEAFVEAEIAAGSITAPGWSIPRIRAAWCSSNWIGLPMPSLNPLQETKAALERISGGLSNRELESSHLTATTFADNIDRITQENAALALANESIGVQNTGYQLGHEPVPGAESSAATVADDNPDAEPDAE